jgi:hypothetical protein
MIPVQTARAENGLRPAGRLPPRVAQAGGGEWRGRGDEARNVLAERAGTFAQEGGSAEFFLPARDFDRTFG